MSVVAQQPYIEQRNGGYYIAGTRISLDSVVYAYRNGESPESIVESFPLLTLEQVYGAIAFYLGSRSDIDHYLANEEAEFYKNPQPLRVSAPALYEKLMAAKATRLSD